VIRDLVNGLPGFLTIEPGFGIPRSDETGFKMIEPMIKLSWEPNSAIDQKFEFKYGFSDIDADESYLGLTDSDFKADPYRRYAGSFLDNITTEQHRTYLKHSMALTDDFDIRIAGYYNQFERDWFKIRNVNGAALHTTLGPTGNPADLLTLRGFAPGNLGYRHNARAYESYGAQFSGDYRIETGPLEHTFHFGIRQHGDLQLGRHRFLDPTQFPRLVQDFNPLAKRAKRHALRLPSSPRDAIREPERDPPTGGMSPPIGWR
jgi:Fe(3+) dicitrate transport protein